MKRLMKEEAKKILGEIFEYPQELTPILEHVTHLICSTERAYSCEDEDSYTIYAKVSKTGSVIKQSALKRIRWLFISHDYIHIEVSKELE